MVELPRRAQHRLPPDLHPFVRVRVRRDRRMRAPRLPARVLDRALRRADCGYFFLVLVIIPFLTSYLIRMYAWRFILQDNGLLNRVLGDIGLGGNHVFLNTHFAVILGLTYGFLPFMILPLYASIDRMDPVARRGELRPRPRQGLHVVPGHHSSGRSGTRRRHPARVHPGRRRLRHARAARRREDVR